MKSRLLRQAHLKSVAARSSRAKNIITFIIFVLLNLTSLARPNPRLRLWLVPGILVMTLLISELGWAEERPRNVTLVLNRTEVNRHANGRTDTNNQSFRIYFGSDGTAYIQTGIRLNGDNVGVAVPPNVSYGSYSFDQNFPSGPLQRITATASIHGQMSNLNIVATNNLCDAGRGPETCAQIMRGFVLQFSGTTCTVVEGTFTIKPATNAPNPTVATSIVGPQTCSILSGRQFEQK